MVEKIIDGVKYSVINTIERDVYGNQCLWFAWATDPIVGPHGEDHNCRPKAVPIPDPNVTHVTVAVKSGTEANTWYHGGAANERTNADGRGDRIEQAQAAYQNAAYGSTRIQFLNTNLCKLVAMYSATEPPTADVVQEVVGIAGKTIAVPGQKTLWLGMHDSFQWNNNGDKQVVEIVFMRKL